MRRTVLVVVAVAVLVAVAALFLPLRRKSRPVAERCVLAVGAEPGFGGTVAVNGTAVPEKLRLNLTCGSAVILEAKPARYWRFSHWLVNGNKVGSKPILRLRLERDTSVVAVFERLNCTVRLTANVTGARARVNGGEVALPYELACPCGSKLTIEPLSLEGYRSLNETVLLTVEENATVRLLYRRLHPAELCSVKGGVYVSADVSGASVVVSDRRVELPACLFPPVELEGEWFVSLNDTHGYWLAWYWVETKGKRYWWSYGLNGSKLRLSEAANVTLHYVLGLRELPYAVRILKVIPKEWEAAKITFTGGYMEVEAGSIFRGAPPGFSFIVELPEGVKYVAVRFEAIGEPYVDFAILPPFLENLSDFYSVRFSPKSFGKYELYLVLNVSAFRDLYETCGFSPNNSSEVPRWLDCIDKWEEEHPHATAPVVKVNKPPEYWDIEEVSGAGYLYLPDFRPAPLPSRRNFLLLVDSSKTSWLRFSVVGVAP